MEDLIDPSAACEILKCVGDPVAAGDILARIHLDSELTPQIKKLFLDCFVISDKALRPENLLCKVLQQPTL